ncbi:hypothetical protein EVAR_47534_1 [Eumeta japonica]|uniref:Uncharacterized protein n=1 Tax=Eumeta variegata TaxID=151549 RepID=A0A4C1XTY3_EUMVA|nr:hypothetical protein EVAR_47534_1 [Eumeta japonica]
MLGPQGELQRRCTKLGCRAEIKDLYMDQDGNMQYKGYLLEEFIPETKQQTSSSGISEEALSKILENFTEMKKDMSKPQNIKNLSEKMCTLPIHLDSDVNKMEILRLFLEDSWKDWYSSMLIKHTIDSKWATWKQNFCETYADKGWSPVRIFKGQTSTWVTKNGWSPPPMDICNLRRVTFHSPSLLLTSVPLGTAFHQNFYGYRPASAVAAVTLTASLVPDINDKRRRLALKL